MWLPVLLAVATLALLQFPDREMFEDPGTLTEAKLEELMDTPEGRTLRAEMISDFRRRNIPDAGIPELISVGVKGILRKGWEIYSGLTDKSQLESRLRAQALSEEAVRRSGQALAEAVFNFLGMYFLRSADAPASRELTKAAGAPEPAALSPLSVLIQGVKDEKVREMLNNYARQMVLYQTRGDLAYKNAATLSLDALTKYIRELEDKADADQEKVTKFMDKYETDNQDVNDLRKQLRSIRREGPKLQDQYETQKKINDAVPETQKNYLLKVGLIVGLFVIAYFASNYIGENAPATPAANYGLKGALVIGLLAIGFVAYTFLLG